MTDPSGDAKITIVQYPGLTRRTTLSPPCGKVHMALQLKGLAYEIKNVSSPMEVRRYNRRGRVPVLLIGTETIVDSSDILTELDRRFPRPALDPPASADRALARVLEDWADEVIYFYGVYARFCIPENFERIRRRVLSRLPLPVRWIAPWIARRETRVRTRGQGVGLKGPAVVLREAGECYRAVDDLLEGRSYLVGDAISRADLAVASVLEQHGLAELTPQLAAMIGELPRVTKWLRRVHERAPGAAREVAVVSTGTGRVS